MPYDRDRMKCIDNKPGHYHRFRVSFTCKKCERIVEMDITRPCNRAPRWRFFEPKDVTCKTCNHRATGQWHCQKGYKFNSKTCDYHIDRWVEVTIKNIDM